MNRTKQRTIRGWVPWDVWLEAFEGDVYSSVRVDNGGGIGTFGWVAPEPKADHTVEFGSMRGRKL